MQRLSGIELTNVGYEVPNICELEFSPLRDIGQYTIEILKSKSGGGLIIIERAPGRTLQTVAQFSIRKLKVFKPFTFLIVVNGGITTTPKKSCLNHQIPSHIAMNL